MKTLHNSQNQKGVALIMAMMIVALVAVVAVEISWRFELSMSRNSNRWYGMQAAAYLQGAEQLAMVVLQEDLQNEDTKESDNMSEVWAQEAMPFPTDHGWVKGQIEDAHGRFNINMMNIPDGKCLNGTDPPPGKVCPLYQNDPCEDFSSAAQIFIRLLQTFNLGTEEEPLFIEQQDAIAITDAVIDWLDGDSVVRGFGGAESDHYDSLEVPVSIANQEMVSVSELQVVRGVTPQLYNVLVNYVIALPVGKANQINVNTASLPVLQSIKNKYDPNGQNNICDMAPWDVETAGRIISFMREYEHKDWGEMAGEVNFPSEWQNGTNQNGDPVAGVDQGILGFGPSNYFLLKSEVGIGEDFVRRGQSLIFRDDGTKNTQKGGQNKISVEVVRRSDANF